MNGSGRTRAWTRHEWVLDNPQHWSEVDKAIRYMCAKADALEQAGTYVVDVQVEGRDDELVVWFDQRQEVKP